MKKTMRIISALLAAILLLGGAATLAEATDGQDGEARDRLTIADIRAISGDTAQVHTDAAGNVVFVEGACTADPIRDIDAAAAVVAGMTGLLGGDAQTSFVPWRTLTDVAGNRYYVFQQMFDGITVLGGAVKVVTDADGRMIGLVSSVETKLPEQRQGEAIGAEEAERLVLDRARELQLGELTPVEGCTAQIVLPVLTSIDIESEDERSRLAWVVYTNNPTASVDKGSDLPYLAHYVTLDGEYLYSLPTILPGDEAGSKGFDAGYVFEFMEPVDYRGLVTFSNGEDVEIDVTVMRDTRTGMYYLGNLERRIVVADCYAFLYDGGRVALEYSPDNREWDAVGLLSLYNYCRAWDYYKEIGWLGGDGRQTPMLILNDFCGSSHESVDNACYIGGYLGWQVFAASSTNDFSQCLDVIAHEFTHCVTGTMMTYNAYMNDYGAINEAISDIQGNICEMLLGATEDTTWLLGEHGVEPVRSMSDPHLFDQPEYSWDLYYKPNVKTPTDINDRGGVHTNSSLLNNVAYRLCADGGMPLEAARDFWFAVDCAMVPGTDYAQLCELLPWVMRRQGLDAYLPALQEAMSATRLGVDAMPETIDENRAMLTLTLPDSDVFSDGCWALQVFSVNIDELAQKVSLYAEKVANGDVGDMPELVQMAMTVYNGFSNSVKEKGLFRTLFELVISDKPDDAAEAADDELSEEALEAMIAEAAAWFRQEFGGITYSDVGSAGQDGQTIRMMCRPGRTIPFLMHATIDPMTMQMNQMAYAVYLNGRWYDLTPLLGLLKEQEESDDGSNGPEGILDTIKNSVLSTIASDFMGLIKQAKSPEAMLDALTYNIEGGQTCELSPEGLGSVVLPEDDGEGGVSLPASEGTVLTGQKSRPVEDAEDAA